MLHLKNRYDIAWPRILAEGTAIVVSILLAFGIQAWWDGRQSIAAERVLLEALLDDLQDKRQALGTERQFNEAILDAVTKLVNAGNDPNTSLRGNELDELIESTWWWNQSEETWDSPPMQWLVSGGSQLVSNPALIKEIFRLKVAIADLQTFYRIDQDFHNSTYTPFLVKNSYMPQLVNAAKHEPGFPDTPDPYPNFDTSISQDHTELLRQKEFHNMLIGKMDTINNILRYGLGGIDEQLNNIIEMIQVELSE